MLETGTVRLKNTLAIMLKNVLDACVGALVWFVLGESILVDGTNSFFWASSRSVLLIGRDTESPSEMAGWFLDFGEPQRPASVSTMRDRLAHGGRSGFAGVALKNAPSTFLDLLAPPAHAQPACAWRSSIASGHRTRTLAS
jgi:hypothetical protein